MDEEREEILRNFDRLIYAFQFEFPTTLPLALHVSGRLGLQSRDVDELCVVMWIAAKVEEVYVPHARDFSRYARLPHKDFLRLEIDILERLDWNVLRGFDREAVSS